MMAFLSAVWAALTSRLAGPIAGGLALVLAIGLLATRQTLADLHDSIDHPVTGWAARLTKAQTDLAQSRANAATLEASVERQNSAIAAMQAAGQAREAALDHVASQARADAQTAQQRAQAILNRPRTGNSCADADAAILEAVR